MVGSLYFRWLRRDFDRRGGGCLLPTLCSWRRLDEQFDDSFSHGVHDCRHPHTGLIQDVQHVGIRYPERVHLRFWQRVFRGHRNDLNRGEPRFEDEFVHGQIGQQCFELLRQHSHGFRIPTGAVATINNVKAKVGPLQATHLCSHMDFFVESIDLPTSHSNKEQN